ncbi:Uncharacterized protein APZ42_033688 [Daphnia magna]|uniref:Uncharacterized protein n=1 Tax=Daphnia magna TaxID=35525 RepID=A0A164KS53_9CRUS|nr:Uncharacterized protein APZ42_033688 [Daphnia magna]
MDVQLHEETHTSPGIYMYNVVFFCLHPFVNYFAGVFLFVLFVFF